MDWDPQAGVTFRPDRVPISLRVEIHRFAPTQRRQLLRQTAEPAHGGITAYLLEISVQVQSANGLVCAVHRGPRESLSRWPTRIRKQATATRVAAGCSPSDCHGGKTTTKDQRGLPRRDTQLFFRPAIDVSRTDDDCPRPQVIFPWTQSRICQSRFGREFGPVPISQECPPSLYQSREPSWESVMDWGTFRCLQLMYRLRQTDGIEQGYGCEDLETKVRHATCLWHNASQNSPAKRRRSDYDSYRSVSNMAIYTGSK